MNNKLWKWNKNPLIELYLYSVASLVLAGIMLGEVNALCEKGGAMCVQGTGMVLLTIGILFALVAIELLFRGPFLAVKVYKGMGSSGRGASIGGIVLYILSLIITIIITILIAVRFM